MKKIVSCTLILAALSSVASMCFAMNGTNALDIEDISEIHPLPSENSSLSDSNTDTNTHTSFPDDNAIIEENSSYQDDHSQSMLDDKSFLDFWYGNK